MLLGEGDVGEGMLDVAAALCAVDRSTGIRG
jgi:hypothetical protein